AGIVSTQDAEGLDPGLRRLQSAHELGLRMLGLTYNTQNLFGCGCTESLDAGLSDLGEALVARMDELGIIVDTAHSGRRTTLEACARSERPVVASHTSAAGLYPHQRAKSDEELAAIAAGGGVIGVYAVPFFLTAHSSGTVELVLDHIDYIAALVGWEHVAIGSDWPLPVDRGTLEQTFLRFAAEMGFREEHGLGTWNLEGFADYRDWPNLARGLVARGYSDEQAAGILGENFMRVFEAVCG
ncbi:MAG TPA: membrane dipeptidase, partial [Solirubrobacterales bacterium]|nr:membrane dipeptidase [Solirubrobacterales bacterium]